MLRRCLSLLVIAGLFAGQLASVPHAHAGLSANEQRNHAGTPHFHCVWTGHDHHRHGHSHGGRHHAHPSPPAPSSRPGSLPDGSQEAATRYVATTVYCPAEALNDSAGCQSTWSRAALAPGAVVAMAESLADLPRRRTGTDQGRPPGSALDGSPIYLTLRNLRI